MSRSKCRTCTGWPFWLVFFGAPAVGLWLMFRCPTCHGQQWGLAQKTSPAKKDGG